MDIRVERFKFSEESTIGHLYVNNKYECDTLEDTKRDEKVYGKTCIPEGLYEVNFRKDLTPMTEKYRKKYSHFFSWHLELKNVENFTSIYIHIGNYPKDTEGCLLVGDYRGSGDMISHSTIAYESLYTMITAALLRGEDVTIKIEG